MSEDRKIAVIGMGGRIAGRTLFAILELFEKNTKLKTENEQLKQNIIDGANDTYSLQKLDHELLTKEIEQLKAELEIWQSTNLKLVDELTRVECENYQLKSELEQSVIKIKQKIINRRWKFASDTEPIEGMCMQWANRMNDMCVKIVEEAEQTLKSETTHD